MSKMHSRLAVAHQGVNQTQEFHALRCIDIFKETMAKIITNETRQSTMLQNYTKHHNVTIHIGDN